MATTTIPLALFALFQMKFAIITPSLITGSFAERVHFSGYLLFCGIVDSRCILSACSLYMASRRIVCHDACPRFCRRHSGACRLGHRRSCRAIFLGRRTPSQDAAKPANVPFVLLGAALLWLEVVRIQRRQFACRRRGVAISAFLNTNTAAATLCGHMGGI